MWWLSAAWAAGLPGVVGTRVWGVPMGSDPRARSAWCATRLRPERGVAEQWVCRRPALSGVPDELGAVLEVHVTAPAHRVTYVEVVVEGDVFQVWALAAATWEEIEVEGGAPGAHVYLVDLSADGDRVRAVAVFPADRGPTALGFVSASGR